MSTPSARRALIFDTPGRPAKRARKTTRRMRIPRSLLPEMKHAPFTSLSSTSTNYSYRDVGSLPTQGDDSDQFVGTRYRLQRLRVNYDFTSLSPTSAIRILVTKGQSSQTPSLASFSSAAGQPDYDREQVLFDRILSRDDATKAGTFDVRLRNLLMKRYSNGSFIVGDTVYLSVYGVGLGSALSGDFAGTVWYTDN